MSLKLPSLLLIAASSVATAQQVTHRWSFNDTGSATNGRVLADAVSEAPAVIRGDGAILTGAAVTLPGTTNGDQAPSAISAYIDLPNGIISSKTDLTLELWATVHSSKSWQRLFDFGLNTAGELTGDETSAPGGTQSTDQFMLAIQRGDNLSQQRFSIRQGGSPEISTDASVAIATGVEYHIVAVYQSGIGAFAADGGRMTWYRDGVQVGTQDVAIPLAQLRDVNNWLGRSQWSGDSNAHISYNEVRLHDSALTPAEIVASRDAGPDAELPPPTVESQSLTMHRLQKVRVDAVADAIGEVVPASLALVDEPAQGTVEITADGALIYTHTSGTPASDAFSYQISNTSGQSSTATIDIQFADSLRLENTAIDVPDSPPATRIGLSNAFGDLSFDQPVCIASPPGDTQRVFVCQKGGLLRMVPDVTSANPTATAFLNLPALLSSRGESINSGSESGLLGLAFHPDYANNRYFYIFYSVNSSGLKQRVSRFTTQADDPSAADPASELILISQADEAGNHNGGDLHFGPDGYLYISVGDEGGGNDQYNNSQIITKDLFAGILRIDVDKLPGNIAPTPHVAIPRDGEEARFSIPIDNPFVHTSLGGPWDGTFLGRPVSQASVRREFYAVGLRNPWRMSFDPATGELWTADVGQGTREEIDLIVNGGNYGWAFREGMINGPKANQAPANFNTTYHVPPIYDYQRGSGTFQGNSVTGGLVYRGDRVTSLTGKYIFADYVSGNIWSLARNPGSSPTVERIAGEGGITAFGTDPSNQDLLLADIDGNRILRLGSTESLSDFPTTLTQTGLFADVAELAPAPGLLPYSVNLPFWSDYATKRRWFMIPDGSSTFTWSREGSWQAPVGALWVKHFDLEMERGNPASAKRIETRLLVKTADGAYGVTYRWNDEETEATLVPDDGQNLVLEVIDDGNPTQQIWRLPSRSECMSCHTPQAGHSLSFNTRQLNLDTSILAWEGNQIDLLREHGFFSNTPESPHLLPRHLRPEEDQASMEARVRAYLDVNCAYCHMAGGTAPGNWDGRAELTLEETGLINGPVANNGGDPQNRLIVPGAPEHSVILHRMAGTNGFTRMPPIATNEIDHANVQLLTQWIAGELAERQSYDEWREAVFGADNPSGEPTADPDGDGSTNRAEYLAGTGPRDGTSALRPQVAVKNGAITLSFDLPVNRSYLLETSNDLATWTAWDVPGNLGIPVAGGLQEISAPAEDPLRFFRVQVREN